MIPSTDTVVYPWTVVVVSLHTAIADSAVMSTDRSENLTSVADLEKRRRRVDTLGSHWRQCGGLRQEARVSHRHSPQQGNRYKGQSGRKQEHRCSAGWGVVESAGWLLRSEHVQGCRDEDHCSSSTGQHSPRYHV